MKMSVERWWNGSYRRKPKRSRENPVPMPLYQTQISLKYPGNEPAPPQ